MACSFHSSLIIVNRWWNCVGYGNCIIVHKAWYCITVSGEECVYKCSEIQQHAIILIYFIWNYILLSSFWSMLEPLIAEVWLLILDSSLEDVRFFENSLMAKVEGFYKTKIVMNVSSFVERNLEMHVPLIAWWSLVIIIAGSWEMLSISTKSDHIYSYEISSLFNWEVRYHNSLWPDIC